MEAVCLPESICIGVCLWFLLEGRLKEVEDPLGEFEYLETDPDVPENFIPDRPSV